MESYLKKIMRQLLDHRDNLNEYVNSLYANETDEEDYNALFGELKKEGLINCIYADNRAYNVQLTLRGKNLKASELKMSDKEELLELIGCIVDIEKYFHRLDGSWAVFEEIHDVAEYQEWIQQIIMYLQEIYDRTHDQFIWETINLCNSPMNGTDDRKRFNEITGKLKSIGKNIEKYYEQGDDMEGEKIHNMKKTPMIFISHSSKDEAHVELIVKLLKEMGFSRENIFCSTIPGYGIALSQSIYETLLNLFREHDLYVIFVHSQNYYGSPVCLNEMGAAWVLKSSFCSFLLPGFDYSEMKGVVDSSKISIKVDSDKKSVQNLINELYVDLADFFSKQRDTSVVWEGARDEFIDKMNAIKVASSLPVSEDAKKILLEADKVKTGSVLISRSIEGVTVQAGDTPMNDAGVRRDEARMVTAVKDLIIMGFLEQTGDDVYQITEKGFEFLDS